MAKRISGSVGKGGRSRPVSRETIKVVEQLRCTEEEEEELQLAVENYCTVAKKGNEKKTEKAKQDLSKFVKKLKKVSMKDVEKALEKWLSS